MSRKKDENCKMAREQREIAARKAAYQQQIEEERRRLSPLIGRMARMGETKCAIAKRVGWVSHKEFYTDKHKWARELFDENHDEFVKVRKLTDEGILADIAKRFQDYQDGKGEPLEQWEVLRIERARARFDANEQRNQELKYARERHRLELEMMKVQLERERMLIKTSNEDTLVCLSPMTEFDEQEALRSWQGDYHAPFKADLAPDGAGLNDDIAIPEGTEDEGL